MRHLNMCIAINNYILSNLRLIVIKLKVELYAEKKYFVNLKNTPQVIY